MMLSFTHPWAFWALILVIPVVLVPVLARGRLWRATPLRVWWSLALRAVIALALLFSLAGAQWARALDSLTVVYLLDLSDSIPASERERAEAWVRQSIQAMPSNGQAAIVAFGENALVERPPSASAEVAEITSAPGTMRTNIAAAIRLGLALFPEASRKRMIILSDGLENVERALEQVELAAARHVEISYVPLRALTGETEAYLDRLEVPGIVRLGQRFDLTVMVESTVAQSATIQLFADGALVKSLEVNLQPGANRVRLSLTVEQAGFRRYRAELIAARDTLPQNNLAAGFTVVQGPPRILLVEGKAGEAEHLAAALRAVGMEVAVMPPAQTPQDLATLSGFDAVFLVNAPAETLPHAAMQALPRYVRELGRGLVMVGGESSFGAGGYLRSPVEEALPVDMDVRSREQEPNLALVLAVDKSGSMGRCHCDDPNLSPGQYQRVQSGLPKIDIAKEAILRTFQALGRLDFLGVVTFDEDAHWALRLRQLASLDEVQGAISGIDAYGQTNIFAGLNEATQALAEVDARIKHIILLTDGWSRAGAYEELIKQMHEQGITLSVIAAGRGSAAYLQELAQAGGGRYYPVTDIQELPQLFLKEAIQAAGSYVVERPFYPLQTATTQLLEGIDVSRMPGLYGYNGTTPKKAARVVLVTDQGDPLLAYWQYGLGRSMAWTSDLTSHWAAEWVRWDQFTRFVGQLASWVLPEPTSGHLQVTSMVEGDSLTIEADVVDSSGQPWDFLDVRASIIGPELTVQQVALTQTASGHYQATVPVNDAGAYLVQVVASEKRDAEGTANSTPAAMMTTGVVIPYSLEHRQNSHAAGEALLRDLAQRTQGQRLNAPDEAWRPGGKVAHVLQPVWPSLLLLAALLFPLDIAVRRLRLSQREWARLGTWIRARRLRRAMLVTPKQPASAEPNLPSEWFAAHARGRLRGVRRRED
ncbi:MAG: VWA domain-containing protein [Anaerolineae bacterium]|nr:VWA domain-containing protein [Anaerolineae bacterium]MDW8098699.1 VWA domain-containing protein [Anaerolineae bacterium]